jgi:RNA polymerase sigma-70 factor, ECF subfamily
LPGSGSKEFGLLGREAADVFRRDPLANPEQLIRRVYSYVAYRVGDGPNAEDVTSETFERALRYRKSYDPSKGDPIAWVLGIARRCIDASFARSSESTADSLERAAPGDLEEDTARRLGLKVALDGLSERERELIGLRFGADLTARQIGELLDLKTNAVEVALHRALARLRETLEGPGSDPAPDASTSEKGSVRVRPSRPV